MATTGKGQKRKRNTLDLRQKRRLCDFADNNPTFSNSRLGEWAAAEFKLDRALPESTVRGIRHNKRKLSDVPDCQQSRKRVCNCVLTHTDSPILAAVKAFKQWHRGATITIDSCEIAHHLDNFSATFMGSN